VRGTPAISRILQKPPLTERRLFHVLAAAALFSQPASWGQALQLSPASASPGERVAIQLSLKSPGGQEPSALQWDATVELARLSPFEENAPGPAAQAAGKSLGCALKTKTPKDYTSVCILYGGTNPVRNGVIAILYLQIAPDAQPGSCRIRIDHGLAVLKDLKRVPLDPVETVLTVREK
jgi:hypothetical protein